MSSIHWIYSTVSKYILKTFNTFGASRFRKEGITFAVNHFAEGIIVTQNAVSAAFAVRTNMTVSITVVDF